MVDTKLGRRRTLMIGAVIMMVSFYVLGGMIYGIQKENGGSLSLPGAKVGAKGYIAMVCIYIFAVGYEFSWGPVVWVVCSEIYPTRIRAMALSIATAFNWAMNAAIAKVTPIMIAKITYGTYFFFGSCAVVMGLFAYFLLPETRGRSLEEMDEVSLSFLIIRKNILTNFFNSCLIRDKSGLSEIHMLLIKNKSNATKNKAFSKSKSIYSIYPFHFFYK